MPRPIVAFLTDFGTHDHYVGAMKGVVLGICPDAALVDLTHEIPPQDVLAGALELAAAYRYFPERTVFLCVVDPGVGSQRRAIAVRAEGRVFVGPDNGLLSLAAPSDAATIVELANPRYALPAVSRTFEGRDRFAPAAAWLAAGVDLATCGPPLETMVRLEVPSPRVSAAAIDGEVWRVDRFGNLITNVPREALDALGEPGRLTVAIAGQVLHGVAGTYADLPAGALGALVSSTGHLEIAVRGGSAASAAGSGRGTPVHVARRA